MMDFTAVKAGLLLSMVEKAIEIFGGSAKP
jgi:hypothetical protein